MRQAVGQEAEEDEILLITTNQMLIMCQGLNQVFQSRLRGVGSREEEGKERSLRSERAGLRLRFEGEAGRSDSGVLGPEVGEPLRAEPPSGNAVGGKGQSFQSSTWMASWTPRKDRVFKREGGHFSPLQYLLNFHVTHLPQVT